jgi:hypothetical protein
MGTKVVEKCTARKKYFVGQPEQPRHDKNLLYRQQEPYEPTKEEGPLSYVLLESPFASVLAVSRGHPTLVSLVAPITIFPLSLSHPADGRTCLCLLARIAKLRHFNVRPSIKISFYGTRGTIQLFNKNFILNANMYNKKYAK